MNLEAQCLAMARDQGDIVLVNNKELDVPYLNMVVNQYKHREAVVEAIRNKIKTDFKFKSVFLKKLGGESDPFWLITCEARFLREAYLRASGLWVEEGKELEKDNKTSFCLDQETKDEITRIASRAAIHFFKAMKESGELKVVNFVENPKEEEVVLPSNREIMLKPKSEMTELEKFILYYDPFQIPLEEETEKLSQDFRNRLKSVLEEARRGK